MDQEYSRWDKYLPQEGTPVDRSWHHKVTCCDNDVCPKSRKPRNMQEQLELWRAAARNKKEDAHEEASKKPLPHLHPLVTQLNKELHAAEKEMLEKKDKAEKEQEKAEKEKSAERVDTFYTYHYTANSDDMWAPLDDEIQQIEKFLQMK